MTKYLDPKTNRVYEVSQVTSGDYKISYRKISATGQLSEPLAAIWTPQLRDIKGDRIKVQSHLYQYAAVMGWQAIEEKEEGEEV